jgi:branched-chain amino acid transport system permease protein
MSDYVASIGVLAAIWAILALSLNLVTGYAGQISLAQGAMFGIGAYTAALVSTKTDFGFPQDLVLAVAVTGAVGALMGLPALRVRHDFLVLTTLGLNFVVVALFTYVPFFGGAQGIYAIPLMEFRGSILSPQATFWLVLGALVLTVLLQVAMLRTWFGLRMRAIRDDEDAAVASGISVAATKIWAFAFSGAFAGLAGGLYAHFIGSVFPTSFGFIESITILAMVILGGEATIIGPIVAAVILRSAPELMRFLEDWRLVIYGTLLAVVMRFQPAGLLGHGSPLRRFATGLWQSRRDRANPRTAAAGDGESELDDASVAETRKP